MSNLSLNGMTGYCEVLTLSTLPRSQTFKEPVYTKNLKAKKQQNDVSPTNDIMNTV